MDLLPLQDLHAAHGTHFIDVHQRQVVKDYGDVSAEYGALKNGVVLLDLSYRDRLCLLGADRLKFLHGQVTNNVKDLGPGQGCHAALVSAKGKIQGDLHVHVLENEILLDIDPGEGAAVQARLEKYVIAEDVQMADVRPQYGQWSIQGPGAAEFVGRLPWGLVPPPKIDHVTWCSDPSLGELYLTNRPRVGGPGFDLYIPLPALPMAVEQLLQTGGRLCGWDALEVARIEAGIPRFGVDMDQTNLAPEVFGPDVISYAKGCYIGQEIIARIRTYGQVAKALRRFRLPAETPLPARDDKIFLQDKEVGYITSAALPPNGSHAIALGYLRREANAPGVDLRLKTNGGEVPIQALELSAAANG
jgi:folate-binding protein YgfZ